MAIDVAIPKIRPGQIITASYLNRIRDAVEGSYLPARDLDTGTIPNEVDEGATTATWAVIQGSTVTEDRVVTIFDESQQAIGSAIVTDIVQQSYSSTLGIATFRYR